MASNEQFNEVLDCNVCFDRKTDPKKLPCDHSFCANCVKKLVKSDKIKCPLCNEESDSRLIKHDFRHGQFLDILMEAKAGTSSKELCLPCEYCKTPDTTAEAWCKDCDGYICVNC